MTQAFFDFEDGSWADVIEEDDAATYERELHEWMEAQKSDDLKAVEKERDEWRAKHAALRADVEKMRRAFGQGVWPDFKGVLARDADREPRQEGEGVVQSPEK